MKRKKKNVKKLNVSRETVAVLDAKSVQTVAAAAGDCTESIRICSEVHTCVSCNGEIV